MAYTSDPLTRVGASVNGRNTGNLLATQGYVIGIEISGSGSRQSVALADLNGKILYRIRRPLNYVPDTETVLQLVSEMLTDVTNPERLLNGRIEHITAEQVFRLAAEGDTIASHLVTEVLKYLGNALANIVLLVNPGMIILGGPLAQSGELLINPLYTHIQELCPPASSQSLHIVQGGLGSEANLVGAVTLALQDL